MKESGNRKSVLALRLREARERLGVSQMKLGVLAGIDEYSASARINQYERGVHEPGYATARQLALALGVPVAYLYAEEDSLAEIILRSSKLKPKEQQRLIVKLRTASDDL